MAKQFLGIPQVPGLDRAQAAFGRAKRRLSVEPEVPSLTRPDAQRYRNGWEAGVPTPADTLKWGHTFPVGAHVNLNRSQLRRNIHHATRTIRDKRSERVAEMPDWQELRDAASAIKENAMANLAELLQQLEANVTAAGGHVHWARDAAEANEIAYQLIKAENVDEVVKIKSMVTQETNLNKYLGERGIKAWETDLAEMIVQLGCDMPSHIVVPAIHRNRAEIRAIFAEQMGDAPADMGTDPRELTLAARAHLRKKFLQAKVAVCGSNMMVAQTGAISIFESEGNGRMCLTLPETLIAMVGIEKIVPSFQDLEVFTQLLPRSATGERMNPYTSFWTGVTPGDGPQNFHLILVDNGRSKVLADPIGRQALHCIRCGACMNACPVYEHVGGHAYGSVYPGPIGAVLTPMLRGARDHKDPGASLPFASSLCGACFEACPMKIDIPTILVEQRRQIVEANRSHPDQWDIAMRASSLIMRNGKRFAAAGRMAKFGRVAAVPHGRITFIPGVAGNWTRARDFAAPPKQTFRDWWQHEHRSAAAASAPRTTAASSCVAPSCASAQPTTGEEEN